MFRFFNYTGVGNWLDSGRKWNIGKWIVGRPSPSPLLRDVTLQCHFVNVMTYGEKPSKKWMITNEIRRDEVVEQLCRKQRYERTRQKGRENVKTGREEREDETKK